MRAPISLVLSVALLALPALARRDGASVVAIDGDRFVVKARVAFATGTAVLGAESATALDDVAAALNATTDIDSMVVEGHTDSVGNAEANRALSLARAKAVVAALVSRGVKAERLSAKGFGDAIPVASNDGAPGREKNRRVEFTILSRAGRSTSVAQPLAKIAAVYRDVDAKAPEEPKWQDGNVGLPLYRAWRVTTKASSSADVAFKDTSRIHLRETTLIVVFGDNTYDKKETRRATLESGALVSRIDELLSGAPLQVESSSGTVELGRGRAVVDNDGSMARVSNHKGDPVVVRARTGKKTPAGEPKVVVDTGMGTRVKAGQAPEPPRPLPAAPVVDSVPATAWNGAESVVALSWGGLPAGITIVEIRAAVGDQVVFQARLPSGISAVEARGLPVGGYQVAVSRVDADGLESIPAAVEFAVAEAVPTPVAAPAVAQAPAVAAPAVEPVVEPDGLCEGPLCPILLGVGLVVVVVAGVVTIAVVGESQ